MKKINLIFFWLMFVTILSSLSHACPRFGEEELVDYNCNQRGRLLFTGDSIVRGTGDEKFNNNGGYPKRLANKIDSTVFNYGYPGITSGRLYRLVKESFERNGEIANKMIRSDFIFIAVGVNDYWLKQPVSFTVREIRALVKTIKEEVKAHRGTNPFVVIATLVRIARSFQAPFVRELNSQLLAAKSNNFPVLLRFDDITDLSLRSDGIHPSADGYKQLANYLYDHLFSDINKLAESKRPDLDIDGIYDKFELYKFNTDPTLADTDGDDINDGTEVFTNQTNPLDSASF